MAVIKSYRKEIIKLTGMTKEQYTKEYDVFKIRVRNYNRLTGANLSASEQFYYYKKQIQTQLNKGLTEEQAKQTLYPRLRDLTSTSAKSVSAKKYATMTEQEQEKLVKNTAIVNHLLQRYSGILNSSPTLETLGGKKIPNIWREQMRQAFNDYRDGKMTLQELYTETTKIANDFNEERNKVSQDALIGS